MKYFYLGAFIFVLALVGMQQIDNMNTELISVVSQRNREQSRFLSKTHDILELQETLHSKQNEIDEMRANQRHLSELQEKLQENYEELANSYIELAGRIKAIEDYRATHKGTFL